eukprot:356402-Chlamydomonas_euryale.AAC.3
MQTKMPGGRHMQADRLGEQACGKQFRQHDTAAQVHLVRLPEALDYKSTLGKRISGTLRRCVTGTWHAHFWHSWQVHFWHMAAANHPPSIASARMSFQTSSAAHPAMHPSSMSH